MGLPLPTPSAPHPEPGLAPLGSTRGPRPKLLNALRSYTLESFGSDVTAGMTVGLIALPLAMAFAIVSGLPPEAGIYCAIVASLLVSALGGSMVQIAGPTGAFVVVVAGIVAQHGAPGLFVSTMMAGVMLVALGATGIGQAIRFIPRPVIVGFTNGIAVLIATTQIKDFFGLSVGAMPGEFVARMTALAGSAGTAAPAAVLLSAAMLALLIESARRRTRVPGPLLALFLGTLTSVVVGLPVDTIESRFHGIPGGFPAPSVPPLRAGLLLTLLPAAFAIAILGAIESVRSAVAADRATGDRHNPNVELVAQGVANLAAPFFGGLPATGALARTAANVRAGARTPVAGIVHAVTLLAVVLAAAPLAGYVPMPVLAAIVLMVAWQVGGWREVPDVFRTGRTEVAAWLVTLLLTLFADLTQAVPVGMALAGLLFIRRAALTTDVAQVTDDLDARSRAMMTPDLEIPPYVSAFRVTGPLIFGATDELDVIGDHLAGLSPIVLLQLESMTALDATGLDALEDLTASVTRSNRVLIVSGARAQPAALMARRRFAAHIGDDRICETSAEALERARAFHAQRFSGAWPQLTAAVRPEPASSEPPPSRP